MKHTRNSIQSTLLAKKNIDTGNTLIDKIKGEKISKRIQLARGWCDTIGGTANCTHLSRLSGGTATQIFGEASRASPQHGWRSAYSLRETIQDQNQHQKPFHTHALNPYTLKYTNLSIQPPQPSPPHST